MGSGQIQAISFDADQTLWDFRAVQRRALEAAAGAMVDRGLVDAGAVGVEDLQRVRDEIVVGYRGRPHSLEEVRRASFAEMLVRHGQPRARAEAAADELVEVFMEVRFNQIELYPEVRASLDRLGARYRLGLLSNGNSDPDRCGLAGVFDAVVLGPVFGFEKPDPRAFELMARELGVEPRAMVHVGDDWDDVQGANRVGAMSVYLNRDGTDPGFRSEADHEIQSLVDLERLLAEP